MRPRVLVLGALVGALLGTVVAALLIRAWPACTAPAVCRIDPTQASGCAPGPCEGRSLLPRELWLGVVAGLVLGFAAAVAVELLRRRPVGQGRAFSGLR